MNKYFNPHLKKLRYIECILKLIPIPIGIITAKLTSEIVNAAIDGKVADVLKTSVILLAILIGTKVFTAFTDICYKKAASQATQKCKMVLYNNFLLNPLHALYASSMVILLKN